MTDTKNNCGMHERLVAYLYGEATSDEIGQVQNHLAQCKACTDELEAFERVRGMLQQWQIDDLPVVRVAVDDSPKRSFIAVLKQLFTIAPVWAKAAGAVAVALLVFSVVGTDVRVGSGGVSFHTDLLRRQAAERPVAVATNGADVEKVRGELRAFVNQLITEGEAKNQETLKAQLTSLESDLQNAHSADLARLKTRIEEHQMKIRDIERDIDRREGTDLTDILFSEVTKRPADYPSGGGGR